MKPGIVRDGRCVLFAYHDVGYVLLEELLRMGAPIAALYTHPDAADEEIWWRSCADLASSNGIPVHTTEKFEKAGIAKLRRYNPDVIYSAYYRNLLPPAVLECAPRGAYNLHGSLLPRYRGRAPVNWMLINGESRGGMTLHHMVARADAGDIVAQREVTIDDDDTALTLYRKLVPAAAALIREYHPLIVARNAPRHPQDLRLGSYYGRRGPEDGRIEWAWPARRIFNLVRALTHPYPGAFGFSGGRKLFVWQARIASDAGAAGAPGTIVGHRDGGAVEVAAGDGSVLILRAQLDGFPEEPAASAIERLGDRYSSGGSPDSSGGSPDSSGGSRVCPARAGATVRLE